MRRTIFSIMAVAAASLLSANAAWAQAGAQDWPSQSVKVVVPFTPGGSNDVLARLLGQKLQQTWKQPFVVENRAGAAGNIGTDAVAKAAPDGNTLLIAPNNVVCMNPSLYAKLPFDPAKDFVYTNLLGTLPVVLVVNPSVPAKTPAELVAYAKANPDRLAYGSSGAGSPQHLSAELFKSGTKAPLLHVPYKGAAPATNDLLAGQIQVLFGPINSVLPHIKAGKLRALAVGGDKRVAELPGVPTINETVMPGYNSDIWISLAAPAGTPNDIIEKLHREVNKVMAEPDTKEKLAGQGIEPGGGSRKALEDMIKADCARWSKLIKEAKIRAD